MKSRKTGTATRIQAQTTSAAWQDIEINRRDADGRHIETRQPGGAANTDGSGADAQATVFSYYTRGNTDPDCNVTGHPERAGWDGLACKTAPAAQPAGTPIPATYTSEYNTSLLPTRSVETSGSVTRTTTTSYDDLGRAAATKTQVAGSGAEGDTVETITGYDSTSGLPATQTNPADSSRIATTYDTWGRPWTYTDAGDNQSVTTYTATGQVATFNDGTGTYAYTYNGNSGEHRGLPTSIDLGITGTAGDTLQLRYNAAGAASEVNYPNGMAASYTYDPSNQTALAVDYTGTDGDGNPVGLAAFAATTDVDGRVISYASPASTQKFSFDSLGRLTKTQDTRENGCTTRTYGFSAASERTSSASYNPAAGDPATGNGAGACQTDNPDSSRTGSYDSANRVTNAGYTYDNLGRTLNVPAVDAGGSGTGPLQVSYHANDMVKAMTRQVQTTAGDGTTTTRTDGRTYALDPAGRITSITSTADGAQTSRTLYEYPGDSDSPSNISTTTNGGQTWTSQRNVAVAGLGMIASVIGTDTTWQITNLHGDTVASVSGPIAGGIAQYSETDEFGRVLAGGGTDRYTYLGSQQRSAGGDTLAGIVLMGARLYNPATGSFLSPDGVLGGTENSYSYPSDPINKTDTSGMFITAQSVYLGKGYSSWWRQYYRTWTEALNDNWGSDFGVLHLQWYFGMTVGTWLGEVVKLGFRFRWKHKKYRQYGYHNGVWMTRLKYKYYLQSQPFAIYYVKRWLRWRYGRYAFATYPLKMTNYAYSWKSKPTPT